MADAGSYAKHPDHSLLITEEELRQAMELLFFAYRDFTGEADALLADFGFGRAHHRVIYFVGRHPGMAVSELLGILKITKQSLSRVLGQLIDDGFILQRTDAADLRRRHSKLGHVHTKNTGALAANGIMTLGRTPKLCLSIL